MDQDIKDICASIIEAGKRHVEEDIRTEWSSVARYFASSMTRIGEPITETTMKLSYKLADEFIVEYKRRFYSEKRK